MTRKRVFCLVLIAAMLASIPIFRANAAPATGTPGTGTVLGVTINVNPVTKVTSIQVALLQASGLVETVQVSLQTAVTLGLIIPTANTTLIGQSIQIQNTDPLNPNFVLTGILTGLTLVTDPLTKTVSLSVTVRDSANVVHTVSLNLADANRLGLITLAVNPAMIGTSIVIDPTLIEGAGTFSKPTSKLAVYFGPALGITADQLEAFQKAGFGYGVIAQACWMAADLGGNAALVEQILNAKKSGDFKAITLPDGKTAANWGQLRKMTLTGKHQNLGSIISGKATPLATPTATLTTTGPSIFRGNGNGQGNGNHGNGHGSNK